MADEILDKWFADVLMNDYSFLPLDTVRYEPHFIEDKTYFFTFGNRSDNSNIAIKFEGTDLGFPPIE